MSEQIGETYVSIVPIVDEAAFKQQTQQAVDNAVGDIKAGVQVDTQSLTKVREDALTSARTAETQAAQLAKQQLLGAASLEQATVAAKAYADAALVAARADVALNVATGEQTATLQTSITLLRQHEAALLQDAEAKRINAGAGIGGGPGGPNDPNDPRGRRTLRGRIEAVSQGEAGLGSLLSPAAIARFGLAGLAIGTVFTALEHLRSGLKVSGDEAFTFEGRIRNAGAEVLGGDLIGGIGALVREAPTASEELKKLGANANTTSVDLRQFAHETDEAAKSTEAHAVALDHTASGALRGGAAYADNAKGLHALAAGERDAAAGARDLAAAFETSVTQAQAVASAIQQAGSEAAAFGEQTRGAGGVAAGQPLAGASFVDETNTNATASSVAESLARRTKGLQDDLAVAKQAAADAATAEQNQKDVVEGAAARHKETVDAVTKAVLIQNQIDADAAAERKRLADLAEAARKKAAAEAEAERKAALAAAREAYRNDLDFRQSLLELSLRRAGLTDKTIADDVAAEKKLIAFFRQESQDRKLTKEERRQFFLALQNEKIDLKELLKGDTPDVGGGSLEDLFKSAQEQFAQFGSNVSSSVTTGGGVREAFAGAISAQNPRITPGQQAQLTEAQRTNQLLTGILGAVNRSSAGDERTPATLQAQVPGAWTAWRTAALTGLTG